MNKAGERFVCCVCDQPYPEPTAIFDDQYGGPVCPECHVMGIRAIARLRQYGISRPFTSGDITPENENRINRGYS